MSDSYQAIYEAVRSRISGGNISDAVSEAARNAFDVGNLWQHAQQEIYCVSHAMQRPSVLYRPELSADGSKWCALYGPDLQVGVAGFGDTPAAAMEAFDHAWTHARTPKAHMSDESQLASGDQS